MKKVMMMATVAMCIAYPAFAMNDMKMDDMKMMAKHCMEKADTNNDNMVSESESDAYGKIMFNDADANNDGMMSMDEMMASHKKMHDEMMMKKSDSMDKMDR